MATSNTATLLVNDRAPPDSIYRYAASIRRCLPSRVRLFNVLPHSGYLGKEYEGFREQGWFIPNRQAESILNYAFWRQSFPKTYRQLRLGESAGAVIHYSSPDIPPVVLTPRSVVTIHDNPRVALETDMYNLPFADKVVIRHNLHLFETSAIGLVQSSYVLTGLRECGYRGECFVIPPALHPAFRPLGIPKAELRQSLGLPVRRKLNFSVSIAARRKNFEGIQAIMKRLGSEYHLVRVGVQIGLGTHYLNVDDAFLNRLYNACDVLLIPSLDEGFGVPVTEAFASGLPVVGSDIPPIKEVSGGAALLAHPYDYDQLASLVKEACNSTELAALGLHRARFYSIESIAPRLDGFYNRVLERTIE